MYSEIIRSVRFEEYEKRILATDRMPRELHPVLMGLFGEVGGIMAAIKKHHREKEVYAGYKHAVIDEFGDVLWYLAAICRRIEISLPSLFSRLAEDSLFENSPAASDNGGWPIATLGKMPDDGELDESLLELGKSAAALLDINAENRDRNINLLLSFIKLYVVSLQRTKIPFGSIVEHNIEKTVGRFVEPEIGDLPTFDSQFEGEERLPDEFEVLIFQRRSGKSYLQINGIFLGDPLTDNIRDPDGYRFHDVFHLSHAAILHWSPVFRALIKHKRKSHPGIDEAQDGGRAIVIEEGLTAWIFSQAKDRGFFSDQKSLPFDLLKGVQKFISGYEVDQCPLKLWERAILEGYSVFRHVLSNNGGIIVGNRKNRTLSYRKS